MIRSTRAFTLVLALLIAVLLLVVGMGFLGVRALEFGSTPRFQQEAVAQALAEAGMEDARVKLEKDQFFPPVSGYGRDSFTYSEDVTDPDTSKGIVVVGSYTVAVDCSKREQPYRVVRILSTGSAGPSRLNPTARYRIYAEIDVNGLDRADPTKKNPYLYRYIDWRESDIELPMPAIQVPQ